MPFLFVLLLLWSLPKILTAQYSSEAQQVKKLSDQYDQRGYMSGHALTVDGSVTLSNVNGIPSYIYPISSYSSNGFAITVSLNYCGAASFTSFHRYYNSGVFGNWSKYHKSAPLWILNVNGFAVQTLSFATTFYNDPYYMKSNNPVIQPPLSKYTDKHMVWTVDGYDVSNRMYSFDITNENIQDVIRILRGDGSILELRNAVSYDNIEEGGSKSASNTSLYTGDYYPHEVNNSGYGRVEFDSAYIKPGYTMAEPFKMPRILKYYPGDGLEYVFREFTKPYGKHPSLVQWTNDGSGAPAFGGLFAGPTLFYLEEINDGSQTVIAFERSRHLRSEQRNLHPDSTTAVCEPTRGRALLTGFTGHTLIYGSNSLVIQALGRTTTVKFATAQYGHDFRENVATSSDMFALAEDGAGVAATSDQSSSPNPNHVSYVGLVSSITDPENRVTQFGYEKYSRTYMGIGFPHDLPVNANEKPVEVVDYRMSTITEPTAVHTLEYYGSTTQSIQASAGELNSADPAVQLQIKYALTPTIKALRKYDRNERLLSSQKFSINNQPVAIAPDFPGYLQEHWVSTDTLVDEVSNQRRWTDYHYHRYEFFSFKGSYQGNNVVPFTQQIASKEVAAEQQSYSETHYSRLGVFTFQPVSSVTKVSYNNGSFITKSVVSYQYDTTTVRSYLSNPGLKDTLGREFSGRTTIVKNPSNPSEVLFKEKNSFMHLALKDTVFSIRERRWDKLAALAEYFRQDSIARISGQTLRWEEVMGCIEAYDTVETAGKQTLPPLYNLNVRSVVTDANNTILQGSSRRYCTFYRQYDTTAVYRGALLSDSLLGSNGVSMLQHRYTYWGGLSGYHKTLLRTRESVNGSVTEFLYDYGCSNALSLGRILYNDNTTESVALRGRGGLNEYESPLGQQQTVRSYSGGSLGSMALTQMYERTYYDQISASVDANGWYSKFSYDRNGRLTTAWLPFDFQGKDNYTTEWTGEKVVAMPGYTIYRRSYDTNYCNGVVAAGGAVNSVNGSRMLAARPPTSIPVCGSSVSGKSEEVLSNRIVFENNKWHRGYCSGVSSESIQNATVLDGASLVMHVSKVKGSCVQLRISVLDPQNILNRWGDNRFDTLLSKVFVLNCMDVMQNLSSQVAGLSAGENIRRNKQRESILGPESIDLPYQQLRIDLKDILKELLDKDWVIEADVLTAGAEVEFVSDGADYQPRLELRGTFREVYALSDYTLNYEHLDAGKHPVYVRTISRAKLDDSLHTSNRIGLDTKPMDNRRYTEQQHWFGGDYSVAKITEVIGNPVSPTAAKDSIVYSSTGFGKQFKLQDQQGDTTSTQYDALGRPTVVYNDDGSSVVYSYRTGDAFTLLGDNDQELYGFAQKTTIRNEEGLEREEYRDSFGRLRREVVVATVNSLNLETKYEYDVLGRLTTVVNPKGDTTRYWYDEYGRIRYKYQPDMGYISYSYDQAGNVRFTQSQQQANVGQLSFTQYDDLNRVVLIGEADLDNSHGDGGETPPPHALYGGSGGHKGEQVLSFSPHPSLYLNRLTDILSGSVLYDDGISSILTANKTVWLSPQTSVPSFWSLSSLAETMCLPQPLIDAPAPLYVSHPVENYADPGLPLALSTSFENISRYPQNARIAVHYDVLPTPGGSVWTHFPSKSQWDALTPTGQVRNLKGRESAVAYRQHGGEPYHYVVMSYDERGRMEAVVHYTENLGFDAVYYTYNSMNMATSVRVVDAHRQYTTWYGYNANGRMDSVWSKLSGVGMGLGITNPVYRSAESRVQDADIVYSYTRRWQVAQMSYPLISTQVQYAYNGRMMLDSLVATRVGGVFYRQHLSYRGDGLIARQRWQHSTQSEQEFVYQYDVSQRLTGVWNPLFTEVRDYLYDGVGNRLSCSFSSMPDAWYEEYDYTGVGGANRVSRVARTYVNGTRDTTRYTYNANGSLVGRTSVKTGGPLKTETMSYDNIQGLLKKYIRTSGPSVDEWHYRSNAMGEREQKRLYSTTQAPVKEWTYYLLSPGKQQLAVYKGVETQQTSCGQTVGTQVYLYPTEYLSYGVSGVHSLTVRPGPQGTEKKEYKLQDILGSTRVVLDGNGAIIGQYDYEPFGELRWSNTPERRLSWIDKEEDAESSLGDFGVRKYDDQLGRFTSIDPLWEKYRGWSPYFYSDNNPLSLKDPSGFGTGNQNNVSPDKKHLPEGRSSGGGGGGRSSGGGGGRSGGGGGRSGGGGGTTAVPQGYDESDPERRPMLPQQGHASLEIPSTVSYRGEQRPVYRGGDNLTLKSSEVKVDPKTGLVRTDYGVSVNVNADKVVRYGTPHQVKSIPEGLHIVQRGRDPGHFEIAPARPMTVQEFQELLVQVQLTPIHQ